MSDDKFENDGGPTESGSAGPGEEESNDGGQGSQGGNGLADRDQLFQLLAQQVVTLAPEDWKEIQITVGFEPEQAIMAGGALDSSDEVQPLRENDEAAQAVVQIFSALRQTEDGPFAAGFFALDSEGRYDFKFDRDNPRAFTEG